MTRQIHPRLRHLFGIGSPPRPPLFARLQAPVSTGAAGAKPATPTNSQIIRDTRASIRRELERLFTTRRRHATVDADPRLDRSSRHYGLPDISNAAWSPERRRGELVEAIAAAIARFEPRLTNVTVEIDEQSPTPNALSLRISADILFQRNSQRVAFRSTILPDVGMIRFEPQPSSADKGP